MSQINVSADDKEWFDEFKESDETQAEAFSRLVEQAKAFQGELVDHAELADELSHTLIPMTEVAAYRGSKSALEGDE